MFKNNWKKNIHNFLSIIVTLTVLTSCNFHRIYNQCKSKREEKRNVNCVKNKNVELNYIEFSINDMHIEEFKNIEFDSIIKNLPLEQIKIFLIENYKLYLNYDRFLSALNDSTYKFKYLKDHGAAGDVYQFILDIDNNNQNRFGLQFLVNWEFKFYIWVDYQYNNKDCYFKIFEKNINNNNSEEIYNYITSPFD